MVKETFIIENKLVRVLFMPQDDLLVIADTKDGDNLKYYAGIDDLQEAYGLFKENFKSHTTMENTIEFFKPQQKIIL